MQKTKNEQVKIDLRLISEISLYQAFVEPFVDVAAVAKLSAKRMINPLTTFIAILNPLADKKWIKERMQGYERRRDAYANEWKTLNDKLDSKLSNDAKLFLFFSNPSAYLAATTTPKALGLAKELALDATGVGPFIANRLGIEYEKLNSWAETSNNRFAGGKESGSITDIENQITRIENQLTRLFFRESIEPNSKLKMLSEEKEDEEKNMSKKRIEDRFSLELKVLGADAELDEIFNSLYEPIENIVDELEQQVENKKIFIDKFEKINTVDDFILYLQNAITQKMIDANTAKNMIKEITVAAKKLMNDKNFVETAQQNNLDPKKVADETVLGVFKQSTTKTIQDYVKDINSVVDQTLSLLPSIQEIKTISKNENILRVIKLIERLNNLKS
jgi:hypothetical protein